MSYDTKFPVSEDRDVLRAEFTAWLNTVLHRARLNYIRSLSREVETVSIAEPFVEDIPANTDPYILMVQRMKEFDFQEERLSKAFLELPLMRREVLRLLFVEERTPGEIAQILHCSEDYVYSQKSKALKRLRERLGEKPK